MEHLLLAYLLNVAWQLPLLAATAAAAKALLKPSARIEHCMWLGVLLASVLLPMAPALLTWGDPARLDPGHLPAASSALPQLAAQASTLRVEAAPQSVASASVALTPMAGHLLAALYLATTAILLSAMLRSLLSIRRLVRNSRPIIVPAPVKAHLARLCRQKPPRHEFRETDTLESPAVVGTIKPVILLPAAFCRRDSDLVVSALLHELAHVSRRDYALNLCCRGLFLAVGWHPLSWLIASAIHESREAACDEAAARGLGSRRTYAENLVTLAKSLAPRTAPPLPAAAVGLLRHDQVEKRVKRLVTRRRKIAAPLAACRAVCVAAILSASAYASATIRIAAVYDTERSGQTGAANRAAAPTEMVWQSPSPSPFQSAREGQHRLMESSPYAGHPRAIAMHRAGFEPPLQRDATTGNSGGLPPLTDMKAGHLAPPATSTDFARGWDGTRAAQFVADMAAARRGAADASRPWQSGQLQRDMEAARRGAADASRPWRSGGLQHDMRAARQGVADAQGTGA
jgi:beta-lactamase regulating signal transducer with metallopeptidase domain